MSIKTEINRIKANVADAYNAVEEMGGTLPEERNSSNLAAAVMSIPQSGGGVIQWGDVNGRPDMSDVSTMRVVPVTLQKDLWVGNVQTVSVPGVLENENLQLIIPVPKRSDRSAYKASGISCEDQDDDALTFACSTVPDKDINVNVFVIGAGDFGEKDVSYSWWSPNMINENFPRPYLIRSSSILADSTAAYMAFDANASTHWHSSRDDYSPWIEFDFGARTAINGLSVMSRVAGESYMPSHGDVEGSDDGESWETIQSFSGWARVDNGRTEEITFDEPARYRYYRIANMDPGYVAIAEIQFLKRED